MTDRELLQQALDMLDDINQCSLPPTGIPLPAEIDHVMEALRARLEEPETVIQARKDGDLIVVDLPQVPTGGGGISRHPDIPIKVQDEREANYKSFAQSAQVLGAQYDPRREPVIDKSMAKRIATQLGWEPKREWVGLTDTEARELCVANVPYVIDMVRALEAKLKEKNNG